MASYIGQQGSNFRLTCHVGRVAGDVPQRYQRGHGDVKGTAGDGAILLGQGQQDIGVRGKLGGMGGVQHVHVAAADGAGDVTLQGVDEDAAGRHRVLGTGAVGGDGHVGVHGEKAGLGGLAAAGEGQGQHQGQRQAAKPLHSSCRPSSARISVASSANSRWPPTGMP